VPEAIQKTRTGLLHLLTQARNDTVVCVVCAVKKSLLLFFLGMCLLPSHVDAAEKESAYERIMRTGTIRCGYIIYPPQLSLDVNTGKLSGIAYDLTERMGKDLNLKIEWAEEIGTANWMEGLHNGRYDVLCNAAWATTVRAPQILVSVPAFFTAVNAYARRDDHRFDDNLNIANAPDFKIVTIDGSTSDAIARESFPKAKSVPLPELSDFSQLLLEVSTRKADITFSEAAQFNAFDQKNPNILRNITPDRPVRLIQNTFFVDRHEHQLIAMLNLALQNLIYDGFVDRVLDRYENGANVWKRIALPYRNQTTAEKNEEESKP